MINFLFFEGFSCEEGKMAQLSDLINLDLSTVTKKSIVEYIWLVVLPKHFLFLFFPNIYNHFCEISHHLGWWAACFSWESCFLVDSYEELC